MTDLDENFLAETMTIFCLSLSDRRNIRSSGKKLVLRGRRALSNFPFCGQMLLSGLLTDGSVTTPISLQYLLMFVIQTEAFSVDKGVAIYAKICRSIYVIITF